VKRARASLASIAFNIRYYLIRAYFVGEKGVRL